MTSSGHPADAVDPRVKARNPTPTIKSRNSVFTEHPPKKDDEIPPLERRATTLRLDREGKSSAFVKKTREWLHEKPLHRSGAAFGARSLAGRPENSVAPGVARGGREFKAWSYAQRCLCPKGQLR